MQLRVWDLIATQEGRYDFVRAEMNEAFPDIVPQRFEDWLRSIWTAG